MPSVRSQIVSASTTVSGNIEELTGNRKSMSKNRLAIGMPTGISVARH